MYVEEIDWCRRARSRGWQIWHEPRALAIHHAGSSTSQLHDVMFAQLWRSRLRYYARYNGPLYNRLVHTLVRIGLRRCRRARAAAVLDLVR
jgi:GT2 family glycosyltransferase